MNGEQEFSNKITTLEKEIIALKTLMVKSSAGLATTVKQTSINLKMTALYPQYAIECEGEKVAIIQLNEESAMISSLYYLSQNKPTDKRYLSVLRIGKNKFIVRAQSQNESDIQKIKNGQSLTLNFNLNAIGTSDFSINTNYINSPYLSR